MRLKKHIRQVIREEILEVPKESYLKYKKLLDKLVDDVFTDFVCGYSWETFNLHHREGTQLRIILYTKNMENLNFELYGQKKQELYNLINDFFPKFNGIFITTDTTKCGEELNESEITERCWKGYTQKGMKTMFGKRYPNCVKIKKKKESKEGVGGYAAPAFEMEPDHVHFKHSYNESNEKQYHMKNLKESIKNILKEEEDGNLEQRFKKSMQKLQYIFEVNISSDIDSLEISEIKFDPKFHYIEGKLTVNSYYEDHDFGGLGKHINSLEDKIFSIYKEYTFTENGGLIKRGPNYDNDWFMNCTPIGMKWGSYGSEPFIVTLEFIISQDEYDA